MIRTHSDDPDVAHAAAKAHDILQKTLHSLAKAERYDYGGHNLALNEYGVCEDCTRPIAEAQAAATTLREARDRSDDATVAEHLELAAQLLELEAAAATIRAELHNGHGTEPIVDTLLAFQYERRIADDYSHSHHGGRA